ncbi:unnamed protein product [Victoria cruziana]
MQEMEASKNHSISDESFTCNREDDENEIRTGTAWTCVAHIITAVIGAGVLSLAWSIAQLGWIAGPALMVLFAVVTCISSFWLSDCYRSPDPSTGRRNRTYMTAVRNNLGKKQVWICGLIQYATLYGMGIAYTVTTSTSMRAIKRSNCFRREGHEAACTYGDSLYMLAFGLIQIICSQIPDFHNMSWLSTMAAIMSFCYSSIGFGLGVAKVLENGRVYGTIEGVPGRQKVWKVSQALGDIAFSYPYSMILLEIEDTIKSPPPENRTMKKASAAAIAITTFFYLCCGCFGYAAFGNETPGNLLTGFGFYEPYWLIDFANACIALHLIGGYQVYSQPIFAFAEKWLSSKYPNQGFINKFYTIKIPCLPPYRTNFFRICFRTASDVQKKVRRRSQKWIVMQSFSLICLSVSLFSLVGSIEGLISEKLS